MYHPVAVEFINRSADLFHEPRCLDLGEGLAAFELLEELSPHCNLQDDIDVFLVFEQSVHLDDVGVVEVHLYLDFSDELVNDLLLDEYGFVDHFQRTDETTVFLPELKLMYLARKTLPYLPEPRFLTSSKLSRLRALALLVLLGVFFIQVFFFYSSLTTSGVCMFFLKKWASCYYFVDYRPLLLP